MAIAPQTIPLPQSSELPAARHPERAYLRVARAPIYAWHLLSLDAPSVAALWAFAFARALHLTLSPYSLPMLFAGTWLLYVADRILDGLRADRARLRERHLFYMRHRTAILAVALLVGAFLLWTILFHVLPETRRADALIFTIAAAYFVLVHLWGPQIERWFPKELIVALVFASATAVPALVRISPPVAPHPYQDKFSLMLLSAIFASLCWLNCVAIEKWERPSYGYPGRLRISPSRPAPGDFTTQWGQNNLRWLGFMAALASGLAAALLLVSNPAAAALCSAATASAVLLIVLDRSRLSSFHLRIAADAALLTPLLVLFVR